MMSVLAANLLKTLSFPREPALLSESKPQKPPRNARDGIFRAS
jgi:hypothetical protein